MSSDPDYLQPYTRAVRANADLFKALLWASPQSQAARFDAMLDLCEFTGRNLLDVGCGRADLLDHLLARSRPPAHYTGIEAVPALAAAAREKVPPGAIIIEDDFIEHPARLLVGADVIVCCGSLNTLSEEQFYRTLKIAFEATTESLAFNFLCSSRLASADWLTWHRRDTVLAFARRLAPSVEVDDRYMDGDCTIVMSKHERVV